jgi:predicted DNA-binding protein (UPF0251 family)
MSRPCKCRRVGYLPNVTFFKPAGIPMRELEEVCISLEEAEAIRLKDLEGLEQEQAAEKMNISRPTFQRILVSAHHKLADVILNGKAVRIGGGNFEFSFRRFKCVNGHEWDVSLEELEYNFSQKCPACDTPEISLFPPPCEVIAAKGYCCHRRSGWPKQSVNQGTLTIPLASNDTVKTD